MKSLIRLSLLVFALVSVTPAHAILSIEITKGLATGLPIAVTPFVGENETVFGQSLSAIIEADLARSGRFNTIPKKNFLSPVTRIGDVQYKDWRLLKADALVVGSMQRLADGRIAVEMHLHDVFKQERLVMVNYTVAKPLLRNVAHQLADIIYEKLTGEPGAFNTRIAYISKEGRRYKLVVSDADGYNARTVVVSNEPLMSPAWSPDGRRLAYVSFEERRSMVFVQSLADGRRTKIAATSGINSAPAWSPDGSKLALVLSHEGNPEIYIYNMADQSRFRLTHNSFIDTEPAWSPDGQEIIFTSDRAGRPQIYRTPVKHERARRVTFEGDYNARASFSADGSALTLVTRAGGRYHAAIYNLRDSVLQILTDTALDESPTFAPNGRMILYATRVKGRGVLATVSADGQVRQLLRSSEGDIREPAWSPNYQQSQNKGVSQ